jgi:hypothetical protein
VEAPGSRILLAWRPGWQRPALAPAFPGWAVGRVRTRWMIPGRQRHRNPDDPVGGMSTVERFRGNVAAVTAGALRSGVCLAGAGWFPRKRLISLIPVGWTLAIDEQAAGADPV